MSTALKDRYNAQFFDTFCQALELVNPRLETDQFRNDVFTTAFHEAELKGRMSHISTVLHTYLSEDFKTACQEIIDTVNALKGLGVGENFEYMFLPDYVAKYGLHDLDVSVNTLAAITAFTSAELAVRPFILKYPEKMIRQMTQWSKHKDPKVRRLASERGRPRLPWAMALPPFKVDPSPMLPILETLKNDPDMWVRRSVANHVNDISKDNPDIAKDLALRWMGHRKNQDAVVKHGCRSLLKAADPDILKLFGLDSSGLELLHFNVSNDHVKMGQRLHFDFKFANETNNPRTVRIEYNIHLLKKNGSSSEKIFKISERMIQANEVVLIEKSHHFKPISTRVYYSGLHKVSVVLNGKPFETIDFQLET